MVASPSTGNTAATAERSNGATFASLTERGATLADLGAHLDALDPKTRIAQVRALGMPLQKRLWDLAANGRSLDLATFVEGVEKTVIYEGKNSLPAFSYFQKRFYRTASGEVFGYNQNPAFTSFLTGPGYFIVEPAKDGEILFDYTRVPKTKPAGWPEIQANERAGLIGGLVFGGMLDYIRYVSRHTVIGAAFKGGKPRNQFFLLTRAE